MKVQPKSLARVTKLCSQLGIELFSDMEAYPASLAQRGRYFGVIVRRRWKLVKAT